MITLKVCGGIGFNPQQGRRERRVEKRRKDKRLSSLDQKLLLKGPLLALYHKRCRVRTHRRKKNWAAHVLDMHISTSTTEGHFCFSAPGSLHDSWLTALDAPYLLINNGRQLSQAVSQITATAAANTTQLQLNSVNCPVSISVQTLC